MSSKMVIEVQWIEGMYPQVFALLAAMDKRQRAEQVRVWCQAAVVLAKHAPSDSIERSPSVASIRHRQRDLQLMVNDKSSDANTPFGGMDAPGEIFSLMR